MSIYRNASDEHIVYRDDSGKHRVKPGGTFELVGEQHAPMVEAIPGVEEATADQLRTAAEERGVTVPARATKGTIKAAIADADATEGAPV